MEVSIRELCTSLKQQEGMYLDMRRLSHQQLEAARDPAGSGFDEGLILKQKAKLVEDLQLAAARARLIESDLANQFGLPEFTIKSLHGKIDNELYQSLVQAYEGLSRILKDITELDDYTIGLIGSRLAAYQRPRQRPTNALQALQAYRDGTRIKKD
ncbi:MAG: hypothetical protein ACM3UW_00315 [Bacillota bacterium]